MYEILDSIANGQWAQVIEQMECEDVNFKELAREGVKASDIAVIADKWIREMR